MIGKIKELEKYGRRYPLGFFSLLIAILRRLDFGSYFNITPKVKVMTPQVKFLTTVWGYEYIKRFTSLSLPSFLAPGNLPSLAASTDLEFLLMTAEEDIPVFERSPAFKELLHLCSVRFLPIDDLITTGMYGVTLTLAYARAVIGYKEEMLNTHFVFMNADFVLGDGSLGALLKPIIANRSIVVAPSFRCIAEEVEPLLLERVGRKPIQLIVSNRSLVDIALTHWHPTVFANTLNQKFCHSVQPNQFYLQVDKNTMIGRFYLIFMLCLKPERVITTVNSYCDYGFIPSLCPSGDEMALIDSDEFFMLELQNRHQEKDLLRLGKVHIRDIGRSLSEWTTRAHRRAAKYTLIFHSEDLPPEIELAKGKLDQFIDNISLNLKKAKPSEYHYYWISGLEAWKYLRRQQGLSFQPSEIDLSQLSNPFRVISRFPYREKILNLLARLLIGKPPFVRPWHINWRDYREIRGLAPLFHQPDVRILYIRDGFSRFEGFFPFDESRVKRVQVEDVLSKSDKWISLSKETFTYCFCYLQRKDFRHFCRVLEEVSRDGTKFGEIILFFQSFQAEEDDTNFSIEIMDYFTDIIPPHLLGKVGKVGVVGGAFAITLARRIKKAIRWSYRFSWLSLFLVAPILGFYLVESLLYNFYKEMKNQRCGGAVKHCSSFFLHIKNNS